MNNSYPILYINCEITSNKSTFSSPHKSKIGATRIEVFRFLKKAKRKCYIHTIAIKSVGYPCDECAKLELYYVAISFATDLNHCWGPQSDAAENISSNAFKYLWMQEQIWTKYLSRQHSGGLDLFKQFLLLVLWKYLYNPLCINHLFFWPAGNGGRMNRVGINVPLLVGQLEISSSWQASLAPLLGHSKHRDQKSPAEGFT